MPDARPRSVTYPGVTNATRLVFLDFGDRDLRLQIDDVIESLRKTNRRSIGLSDFWFGRDAVGFARRALEVSVRKADDAIEERAKGVWKDEWTTGSEIARDAFDAIHKLNRFLANSNATKRRPTPASVAYPIRTMTSRMMPDRSISERHAWAHSAAMNLLDAEIKLQAIAAQMDQYRSEISAERQNIGEPEKVAFVEIWAEAWIALTGRLPGKGSERNPFIALVEAAWDDVAGPRDANFAQALRNWQKHKRSAISDPTRFVPGWAT